MGKSDRPQRQPEPGSYLPCTKNVVCSHMVLYPEQPFGSGGQGMRGFREKAGGWMVMDVISFGYASIMSVIGFFGCS